MIRVLPVLMTAVAAVVGLGTAQSVTATGLLLAAMVALTLAVASTRMLARTTALTRPARAGSARDAWLVTTVMHSPTHTDARALMRPRPPSTTS